MAEYNLGFSEKLIEAAELVASDGITEFDSLQTVIYLSLLSSEISMKALLENAGHPIKAIRKCSHDLKQLLDSLGSCEVEVEIVPGHLRWGSAARLRGKVVDPAYGDATVGAIIEKAAIEASTYPNNIRYGESIRHFPPELVLKMAKTILSWAKANIGNIRKAAKT
jgi:HEPN domain-containing protein